MREGNRARMLRTNRDRLHWGRRDRHRNWLRINPSRDGADRHESNGPERTPAAL